MFRFAPSCDRALGFVVVLIAVLSLGTALQKFGQSCDPAASVKDNMCDKEVGLYCSSSKKMCQCSKLSSGSPTESDIVQVWSKGECRVKLNETCTAKPEKPNASKNATEYRCIYNARCQGGLCQCKTGYVPNEDLTFCKGGASKAGSYSAALLFPLVSILIWM